MAATPHAVIVDGTVTNVVLVDGGSEDGAAYLHELTSGGDTVVDITNASPQPGVGWTTSDGGQTFTAATVTAQEPSAAEQAQTDAQSQVAELAASIPGHITQAQTDAATIAGLTAGQTLTAEQVTAMQNHANGWVTLLQALQTLTAALGYGAAQ